VSARRPWLPALAFAALWLFVFTVPWEDSVLLPGIGTASRFAGLVAFAVGLASVARKGGVALRRPAAFLLPFALLCVWTVLSIEWAPDRGDGIAYAATLVQLFLMSWLVWQQCRDATDRRRLMQAYVLGCYVSVASTVAQYLSGNAFAGSAQERFAAAGFNPNYLASTLALGIPLAWHLVLSGRSRVVALLNFLAIPAVLVAIVLTGSRGGLITAVLALSVVPLTYAKLGPRVQVAVVVGLALVGLAAYWLAPSFEESLPTGIERFAEIPEQLQSGDLTGRGRIWLAGVALFRYNPIVGVGSGGFAEAVRPYLGEARTAHNAFLNVAAQTGVIGLALFVATLAIVGLPFVVSLAGDRIVYLVLLATVALILMPSTLENGKQVWFTLSLAASRSAFVLGRDVVASRPLWAYAPAAPPGRGSNG